VVLASITGQLTHAVALHGVLAVAVIMAVDSVLPVGGEITMLFAGALASGALAQHATLFGVQIHEGPAAYVVLALAGAGGYVAGSAAGWLLGIRGGPVFIERYGRRLHLGPERMARAERWFARFGARAVFIGRLTPLVRSFVSVPAGVLRTPPGSYFLQTIAASLLWCFGFAGAGWALGANYDDLHSALRFFDYAGAAVLVGAIVLVAGLWRRTRGEPAT
jgi:membrane protein DedA with SNARE-associated domain